jgi:hypothetical protein
MGRIKQEAAEMLEQVTDVVASAEVLSDDDKSQRAYWQRDNALSQALTLHKQNGGMRAPNQILADAQIFLNFLKGEVNE